MSEVKLPEMEWDDFETQFPSLFAAAEGNTRRIGQVLNGLEAIRAGHEEGSIRNTVYKEAKEDLSRMADKAWDRLRDRYLDALRNKTLSPAVEAMMWDITIMGLNDFRFLKKKIDKAQKNGAEGPLVDEVVAIEAEIAPLAHLVTAMKGITIKGRAPREVPVTYDNPHQVRGTCSCCFSNQAVVGATMAHHGYQRPGAGWQTASCPGISYQPFEKSPVGTHAMIENYNARIARLETIISTMPVVLKYQTDKLARGPTGKLEAEVIEITNDHPRWDEALASHIRRNKAMKAQAIMSRDILVHKASEWAPIELKTVMGEPAPEGTGGKVYVPPAPAEQARAPSPTPSM